MPREKGPRLEHVVWLPCTAYEKVMKHLPPMMPIRFMNRCERVR